MKLLAVTLAINLFFCYFNGILCSDDMETTKSPPEMATNSRYLNLFFHLKCINRYSMFECAGEKLPVRID